MPLYSKPPKQLILDEINRINNPPVLLTLTNCRLDNPEVISPVTAEGHNTRVKVRAKQGYDIQGTYTYEYERINLSLLFLNMTVVIDQQGVSTLHGGLTNINLRYGLNFTTEDIVDAVISVGTSIPIRAATNSYQYFGEGKIILQPGPNWLNLAVQDRLLDSYHHFNGAGPQKLSGTMLNYAPDFTEDSNALDAVTPGLFMSAENVANGTVTKVLSALQQRGFPTFNYGGARINLYDASVIKGGNATYYSKVCVLSDFTDPLITGPIYMHYNEL